MNYKEAKKIQSAVYNLDAMNYESTYAAAVEHHTYDKQYSVYIYGKTNRYSSAQRAARIAMAIADNSETIIMRAAEYNIGTTVEKMVYAWELL